MGEMGGRGGQMRHSHSQGLLSQGEYLLGVLVDSLTVRTLSTPLLVSTPPFFFFTAKSE